MTSITLSDYTRIPQQRRYPRQVLVAKICQQRGSYVHLAGRITHCTLRLKGLVWEAEFAGACI